MIDNKLQFAVVREDPRIEIEIIKSLSPHDKILLVGSGGCTALTLQSLMPTLEIHLLEPNPQQIELIHKKLEVLKTASFDQQKMMLNVNTPNVHQLNAGGNFESLFRGLRDFICEFVLERDKWVRFFNEPDYKIDFAGRVFSNKYWPVAFRMFFSDELLLAMFGPDAIQHAPPHSYPTYFQQVLEKGLVRADAKDNYFLHHIFLGYYLERKECLPLYIGKTIAPHTRFHFIPALVQDCTDFGGYGLVQLSNIFDWMSEEAIAKIAQKINQQLKVGSYLLFRQLNNTKDLRSYFPSLEFDEELSSSLLAQDRSLFYCQLRIGRKI